MTLAVGDKCTVLYADGGFRVAVPVSVAAPGQLAFLSDFGTSQKGVPLRLQTVSEIAATVPENNSRPRLQRVVGTVVRDGAGSPLFAPLGVMPLPAGTPATGTKTIFVVFADTCPIAGQPGSFANLVRPFYARKAGEYDIQYNINEFYFYPGTEFHSVRFTNNATRVARLSSSGRFLFTPQTWPLTTYETRTVYYHPMYGVASRMFVEREYTTYYQVGVPIEFQVRRTGVYSNYYAPVYTIGQVSFNSAPFASVPSGPTMGRTFESEIRFYPVAIAGYRLNVSQWTDPPAALVYKLPLQSDAPGGTFNEILPTGVTDTAPLTIIDQGFPTAAEVVGQISQEAGADGVRDVRFFTALATARAAAAVQTLIAEVVASLESSQGAIMRSTTPAANNDWLGALSTSALQLPA